MGGCLAAQLAGVLAERAELAQVPDGLLIVVADDLGVLAGPCSHRHLQPAREALMQIGSSRLGDGLVGGVTEQQVPELEGLAGQQAAGRGPQELLGHELQEPAMHPRPNCRRR